MGSSIIKKVTPHEVCIEPKNSIMDPNDRSEISRANFRFIQKLTVTGYNHEQIIWQAENMLDSREKFLIKQIDKLILYDNNRIQTALKQLELWLLAYEEKNVASLFFADLLFAFQDYQYLYMVYDQIEGFTLDTVLKQHVFTEDETKYVVAVLIQVMEFFHEHKYSLTELSPEHLIVEKQTGKLKVRLWINQLLQILNPMKIDEIYSYCNITNPSVYSAPQILAKNKVLAQSDYYTLGTMMYEMMTQKNVVLEELSHLEVVERHHIMAQEIQLKKYNLPEGWNPQAADFLVKLLIKNPLYRLGRYGSFQLRFHPWLQNYNWQNLPTRSGISLNQAYFKKCQVKKFNAKRPHHTENATNWLKNPLVIKIYEQYKYRQKLNENRSEYDDKDFSMQQVKVKKSQKYYDNQSSGSEESEEMDELEMDSEQISKSYQESRKNAKHGRGLLNIIEKGY